VSRPFLTAEWRYLVMLNYEIDPGVLQARAPHKTEVDSFDGRTYVSIVAFMFQNTRVLGAAIPLHRNFEEINLRFYVRFKAENEWRRGVVFIKEIVPKSAIAFVARVLYGENYVALPTRHAIAMDESAPLDSRFVHYEWRFRGNWNGVRVQPAGPACPSCAGSVEEFITEHYWGYTSRRKGASSEYEVVHPRWNVWPVKNVSLQCDVAGLYGAEFAPYISGAPASAFLADGSAVSVYPGRSL
jgi:uncharacterized protein